MRNSQDDNVHDGNGVSMDLGKIPEAKPEGAARSSLRIEKFDHIEDEGHRKEAVAWRHYGVDFKTAEQEAIAGRTVADFQCKLR